MLVHCWKSLVELPNIFILLMIDKALDKALLVCLSIMPFKGLRYSGGGLKFFVNLEKWKISDLSCLIARLNCLKREGMIL